MFNKWDFLLSVFVCQFSFNFNKTDYVERKKVIPVPTSL